MTLEEAAGFLKANDDFIIASHDGPDADGLGAAYALALALRSIGKKAEPVVSEEMPGKFAFMDARGLFRSLSGPEALAVDPKKASFVIVDTHDLGYVGARVENLVAEAPRLIMIDHHEPRGGESKSFHCIDPAASSSSELVYVLCGLLGAEIPEDAAAAIFAGIVYDTGSFAYPKTGERTFSCALDLVHRGVSPYAIHNSMYESSTIGALILQKIVLSSLELASDNRIAIQTMGRKDLVSSGADYEDAEDLINIPLQSGTVEVSVLFKENLEGRLRCSLRSKGAVNVAHIAQNFGGGGHKTASGFTCDRPLARMKEAVLESIVQSFEVT
jgi:phosphoesterase RecJ-like protein